MQELLQVLRDKGRRMIYPQMGGMGLHLTDYTLFQVYEDPGKQLEISLKIEESFPTDFTYPVDFGSVFLHDLGIPLLKPDYDFPSSLENPIKSMEALKKLREAPREKALMPVYLDGIQRIAEAIAKPEMVAVPGPFTLGAELMGVTDLAKNTIKNPGLVDAVLDFAAEEICRFATEAIERGAGLIQISEPTSVILSPAMFAKWVTPRLDKVFACINPKAWSALHICGNTMQYMEEMLSVNPMVLSLDQIMDMGEAMARVPGNIILAGNIDPLGIMFQGTPWQVEQAVETLLQELEGRENFMPSFGCDCPVETPSENMQAFINTVYTWKGKQKNEN